MERQGKFIKCLLCARHCARDSPIYFLIVGLPVTPRGKHQCFLFAEVDVEALSKDRSQESGRLTSLRFQIF